MNFTFFSLSKWKEPNRSKKIFLISLFIIICLIILYRYQLLNGFSILSGDRFDGIINTTILEHWFNFFSGIDNWSQVNYFFPYTMTIAHSDAFFLVGILYTPFRLFGLDPFLSCELTGLIIKLIGFLAMYVLCKRIFSLSFYWALFAATLFTISNGMAAHPARLQLATVAFAPIMATLLGVTFKYFFDENMPRFRKYGLITGIFFGAWCLTCLYMAWFFTLFFTTFLLIIIIRSDRDFLLKIKRKISLHYGSILFVFTSAVVALLPFIYAFISKSQSVGVRSYEEVLNFTVPIQNILQVGYNNFLSGGFYNFILLHILPSYTPNGEYYNTGISIILFIVFLLGCIEIIKCKRVQKNVTLQSLVIATIITWLLILNLFGHSAWFFIFHLLPGAKALRVVSAYQILLALPIIIIAIKYLSTRRMKLIFILILSFFLIAEEINKPPLALNRQDEINRISIPNPPPTECKAFYVSGWKEQDGTNQTIENYAHNVSAMLIAQTIHIPTINGFASFNPPDWNFGYPNRPDYDDRILYYSKKHGITGLCKLDLNNKKWTLVNNQQIEQIELINKINMYFSDGSNWTEFISKTSGLSSPEAWGTWSIGNIVTFKFLTPLPEKFTIHFIASAFGPNIGEDFVAHVGDNTAKFKLTATPEERNLEFNNPQKSQTIKIDIPSPTSPKKLGLNDDDRNLGIGFISLEIIPQ